MRTVGLLAARGLLICVGLLLCAETARAEPPVPDAAQLATLPGWSVLESAHLRFHFSPSSGVGDQHAFAATEERILTELLAYFSGPLSGKIDFYVWKDNAEAMSVLGRQLAFAVPSSLTLHTSAGHSEGHELTHVVVGDVLRPTRGSRLISEGAAVVFDQTGRDLVAASRAAVRQAGPGRASVLGLWALDDRDDALIYPLGGAFVARLIAEGGKERFLELLREPSLERARALYGVDLDGIIAAFDKDVGIEPAAEALATLRIEARARMAKDKDTYTAQELVEIEALYGQGSIKTEAGQRAYALLIEGFPDSNRAGCAALYLARIAAGDDQKAKLEHVIQSYNDSWYGDGTQVGAYARTLLALQLKKDGQIDAARLLAAEVAAYTPNAVEHQGRSLVESLRAAGLL
jgi:hypothetical protein